MNGHKLAREIVKKHGVDRYTTPEAAILKLVEEVGELVREFNKGWGSHEFDLTKFAKEYGDIGISLHLLGDKMGLNLIDEMQNVVSNETRRFA